MITFNLIIKKEKKRDKKKTHEIKKQIINYYIN